MMEDIRKFPNHRGLYPCTKAKGCKFKKRNGRCSLQFICLLGNDCVDFVLGDRMREHEKSIPFCEAAFSTGTPRSWKLSDEGIVSANESVYGGIGVLTMVQPEDRAIADSQARNLARAISEFYCDYNTLEPNQFSVKHGIPYASAGRRLTFPEVLFRKFEVEGIT